MLQLIIFGVASAGLIYLSRASLRAPRLQAPRSHGFYRFFAWEIMVAQFLLNADVWFRDPGAWYQLVSWSLLLACCIPLVLGINTLTAQGKAVKQRESDASLLAFEKTTALVTTGLYHYIRHPLYSSLLFLDWGIFFKNPTWWGAVLAFATGLLLVATARADEAECIRFFGPAYQAYMKQTKRFVPFLF